MKGKAIIGALALSLALAVGAGAEGYSLSGEGLRLYAPQGWQVITAQNAQEHEAALIEMGSTPQVVLSQMERDAAGALIYAADMEARLVTGPDCGVDSVWQADEKGKAAILAAARAAYPTLTGDWINGEWLLLAGQETLGNMPLYSRVYVTCHYGRLYALEAIRYGSQFTPENEMDLQTLTETLVVLGVKATAQGGTDELPQVTLPNHSGTAQVRVSRDETPITLDNPYAEVVSPFVITGTTTPNADLRYYVGGAGVARFKSDEEGRFEVEIKNLSRGKNSIRIQSISEAGYGAVVFSVNYTPATAPVVLASLPETVMTETYEIRGRALPGTQVTLLRGTRAAGSAQVGEDGLFTLTAELDKKKAYDFTLRAEHEDYRKSESKFTLTRIPSLEEQAQAVNKEKLMKNPAQYKGTITLLEGQLTRMDNGPLTGPYLVVDDQYMVLAGDLYGLEEGPVKALVRLNGQSHEGLIQAELITLN
ncbi:MAG: hypothetical protein IJF65_03880 [Clostridia bacterium]|nr:hypothetical protein [Clostridia bacterium]